MIPFHLYMFPLFKEMKMFGLFGNLAGPIACYISGSVAFGSLLYCSFLKGVPLEIEEAAQIDGCNPFQTFWKVTFPLLGPCTASMVVLNGLGIWNDFLMPYLVLLQTGQKRLRLRYTPLSVSIRRGGILCLRVRFVPSFRHSLSLCCCRSIL